MAHRGDPIDERDLGHHGAQAVVSCRDGQHMASRVAGPPQADTAAVHGGEGASEIHGRRPVLQLVPVVDHLARRAIAPGAGAAAYSPGYSTSSSAPAS